MRVRSVLTKYSLVFFGPSRRNIHIAVYSSTKLSRPDFLSLVSLTDKRTGMDCVADQLASLQAGTLDMGKLEHGLDASGFPLQPPHH
jgi:hypothetical protein